MNKNLEANIIFYACSTFVALFFAVICRLHILPLGGDNFTNNTLFVAYFIGVMVLATLIKIAFTDILEIIFKPKEKSPKVESAEIQADVTEPLVNIEQIRQERIASTNKLKSEKLQIALDYAQREFAPYVTDENLKRLMDNIELYAEGAIENPHLIHVKELSNNDLYHFGWNIHNHFRVMNQLSTAQFIKSVFSHSLMNVTDINTIRKKFRNEEATLIKLRCNLSPDEE
ncbi:MAG: hypothetical protein SNH28_03240 [Rikenellaceae bacterium]